MKFALLTLALVPFAGYGGSFAPEENLGADQTTDSLDYYNSLEEIVVTGQSARQRIENLQIGAERLELTRLKKVPSIGGEHDIIKSLALLPGVRSEGDGGGGFEVRGGNSSQNLVTLDGITLYNPAHVMGIFSTFNDQAVSQATLFKGPFPVTYGGATSSVLETSLASGDMERWSGSGTIGILAAKVAVGGPIVKDKLSFEATARRSYVDAFLQLVPKYRSTVMNFYDITAKARWRPSAEHLVDLSFFVSHDNMAVSDVMGMYWGNLGGSLNWVSRPNDILTFTTTASATDYSPKMEMLLMDLDQIIRTYIRTFSLNERVGIRLNDNHSLEVGLRSELLRVRSGEWQVASSREEEVRSLWENSLWAGYEGRFSDLFEIGAGVRADISSVISAPGFHKFVTSGLAEASFGAKTYCDIEPRASLKFNITQDHNIKAGIGTSLQNLHSIRSSSTSLPFDRFALTSCNVRPERAVQYGIGYTGMTSDGSFDWSAEGYFKTLSNVYDYRDGASSFSSIALEDLILGGRGRSYGAEFMIRKNSGDLTGWISYTISRTQTRIDGINDGKWYNATNDRRHDVAVALSYQINDRWDVSASWIFMSGQPLTAPDVKYEVSGVTCYYYSKRNGYLTPPVHRLDLGATYTHVGKKLTYEWSFGVYNAYCRYNPYIVYFEDDVSKPSGTRAVQYSMYGLIPSVSYTLKF
ncbi:MAG: TonB-dependent receptor plug domain-containing protein [Bacteroides sp.]|nr:TonB-dependent receptor plug domain-containing protein [Bacteroides sp.]